MSSGMYLAIMLGVIVLATVISLPSLLRKKCPKCGCRNWLEAAECRECGVPFPED